MDKMLAKCFEISMKAHEGQTRIGGGSYFFNHVLEVYARAVAAIPEEYDDSSELRLIIGCIALLHDVVEDCEDWTIGRIKKELSGMEHSQSVILFTNEMDLNQWVQTQYDSKTDKIVYMMENCSRYTAIVKLADRLCNIKTLHELEQWNSTKKYDYLMDATIICHKAAKRFYYFEPVLALSLHLKREIRKQLTHLNGEQ